MKLRTELSTLLKTGKKEKMLKQLRPTHIVLFGNDCDEQMNNVFCYQDQIEQATEFLLEKVDILMITELGRDVVRVSNTK